MTPIATAVYALGIIGLFWLDRDRNVRTSVALWLPVIWMLLACSRSVNQWITLGQAAGRLSSADAEFLMEGNPVDRFVYGGLVVSGLTILLGRRKRAGNLLQANLPIILFLAYCAASFLWSDYADVAFKRWIKAVGDVIMVMIVVSDRNPVAAIKRLFARAGFLLIPISVFVIKYYPEIGKGYSDWTWTPIYTGVTLNKNILGAICLLFGLASIWRFLEAYRDGKSAGRAGQLIAHGAILAMVLWLFHLANSMTSLSCFVLGCAVLFATNLRVVKRRPALVHVLVATLLLGAISTLFLGVGADFVKNTMGRDTSTLTDRTDVWKLALSLTPSPLFGTGFESFWLGTRLTKMWSVYRWEPTEAHNGYIEIYLNLGWTGVVLLLLVLVTGYRSVIRAYRRNISAAPLMLAFFVAGLIYNVTEAAFFRMMAPVWIFFLLAMVSARALAYSEARQTARRVRGHEFPSDHARTQPDIAGDLSIAR